ncbi:MmgE/PrpD family protein [Micromonospora sp. NPDC000316]|uniref:MmgE/PrpD family protein n=1 Tax=Micromonospora sp. NPDC000316 TaxID=3364216 RepID=UPI0036911BC8
MTDSGLRAAASFAASAPIPAEVLHRARWAFLDTVGVLLAGTGTAAAQAAARTARRSPGAAVVYAGGTASPAAAALANAVAASALDFDDGHYRGGGIHPGSTIVPALLAASTPDTLLDDFLRAQVVGYEVAIRAGHLLSPGHTGGAYRATGGASAIGAAAALARLCGLSVGDTARALRIASAHAPVATLQLPMVKESIGWAAATGVTAVHLVQDGFDAGPVAADALGIPATCFDGPPAGFAGSWGTRWESGRCYVKPYPCCRAAHAPLDGVLALRRAHPEGDVLAVDVQTTAGAAALTDPTPRTLEEAQFSIPYVVAAALHTGPPAPLSWFDDLADPGILALSRRVTVRASETLSDTGDGYPARVTLTTTEGGFPIDVPYARGHTARPLTEADLCAKLHATAGRSASALLTAVLDAPSAGLPQF